MRRLFLILSSIVLLALILGLYKAFTLPSEIEEHTALLNYEHQGRFDYLVYLKPSYLFGPEPQEIAPSSPNPNYFTEIIRSIDMTFTYVPIEEISAEVEVKAVLENYDVWQKEITLVPATTKTGGFTIEFPLDISGLNQLFDTIDEELNITPSLRNVTIVVNVLTKDAVFTQRLPINLGKDIIEIGNNLKLANSGASGEFDYLIHLKENSLFDTDTLKPPLVTPSTLLTPPPLKTIGPGEVIFTNLVDSMNATFYYDFRCDQPVTGLTEEVRITAILENTEVWSKTFVLVPLTKKSGSFSVTFPLDINYLTEMLEAIRIETGIAAQSYNLTITAYVHTVAETEFGPIDEVFSQTLSSALGRGSLEWNEELVESQPSSITTIQMIPNPNKYLGLPVSVARIVFPLLTGIFLALYLYLLVLYMKFKPAGLPEMEREALRAKRRYKDLIIDIQELPTTVAHERVISLSSLDDLITTAEELGKVVLHKAEKKTHTYCVIDAMIRYQYISKQA